MKRPEDHLVLVTQERTVCMKVLDECRRKVQTHFLQKREFTPPPPHGMIVPASNNIMAHYSFDFCAAGALFEQTNAAWSNLLLNTLEGPVFVVCCEAIPRQVNFNIDEASDTRKGANLVDSMLYYFFIHYSLDEATGNLHADNCCGQNKNNAIWCST